MSPISNSKRIKEEFNKKWWRGILQFICSFPVLSELYCFPQLFKNAINTAYHEQEIEAETDPRKITKEKEILREEKSFADNLTGGKVDRDYYFENLPQAFLQLRNLLILAFWQRYSYEFGRQWKKSPFSVIAPFLSMLSVGFTAWKKFMCYKRQQVNLNTQ